MGCIQVWLPTVGRSLGDARVAADLQRAFERWEGENWVYTVPGLREPVRRWRSAPGTAMAVRAELDECFSVFHVAANGAMSGFIRRCVLGRDEGDVPSVVSEITAVPNRPAQELLDEWLNLPSGSDLHSSPSVRRIMGAREFPVFDQASGQVRYQATLLGRAPGPSYAIVQDDQTFRWMIPTGPQSPPSVFPDAESMVRDYGSLDGRRRRPSQVGVKAPPQKVDITITGPLSFLFPVWVGLDALSSWVKMAAMVSESDADSALQRSRALAAPYLFQGTSTWALTWFWPTVAQVGLETAIGRAEQFGLNDARSLDEILQSPQWTRKMAEPVPVVRAYGPIGFFWALVLDRLEERRTHNACSLCGRVLPTRRGKRRRYCSKAENLDCFEHRQREHKRSSRARKSSAVLFG